MRYEVWDYRAERMVASWADEARALAHVRGIILDGPSGRINDLGLAVAGGPHLTYPLEGAALLAKAFGLREDG
jgi:hypothetical protein